MARRDHHARERIARWPITASLDSLKSRSPGGLWKFRVYWPPQFLHGSLFRACWWTGCHRGRKCWSDFSGPVSLVHTDERVDECSKTVGNRFKILRCLDWPHLLKPPVDPSGIVTG